MLLSTQQALDLVNTAQNRDHILKAQQQEERLAMHCATILSRWDAPSAVDNFLRWVAGILPDDKFKRFSQLLTYPFESIDSTEAIFDELSKFQNAPDRDIRIDFTNPTITQDFNDYLAGLPGHNTFWEDKGMEALKYGINSYLIIDLETEQEGPQPEPYYYMLAITAVHDVEIDTLTNAVEYIIFNQDDGSRMVFDDGYFRRFIKPEKTGEWTLDVEKPHDIGYCPACSFYRAAVKDSKGINKRGPITNTLSKLDWLLFFKTSKKYLDLYGAWPIVVSYEETCNYRDKDGNQCQGGYINSQQLDQVSGNFYGCQVPCPECAKRGMIGPGSHLTVKPPRDKDEADLMTDPVKIIEPSNDKLDYGVNEINRLEDEIYTNTTGWYREATKGQINEEQVKSQFESRKAILDNIRKEFEQTQKFTLETMARLRYGNYFSKVSVFLGKEYFLQSPEDLVSQYDTVKKAGLPAYEVATAREVYTRTKFKNNQAEFVRTNILAQLEPYPDYTVQDLRNLQINIIDPLAFLLKLDFINFIAKFERENMNIVEFGSQISLASKITIIQSKLYDYVRQKTTELGTRTDGGIVAGPQAGPNSR
jgi:hypothetical protein